jgi:uncharacterized RmlC-like cupin family protein
MKAPTCALIRPGDSYRGTQGLLYEEGLTGATAGSRAICMTLATLPPGGRAKTHLHRGIESAAYVIEGEIEMYFGKKLEERLLAKAGEYVYIPPDMPHLVHNPSLGYSRAVVAHTSANDQDGIVLLPELDDLVS